MTNVSTWSTTAGSNNGAPPAGWPENMLPGKVNDCAREMMAALSKWYKDSSSTLVTAGTQPAYTLTTNSVHASLGAIPMLAFRIHATNAGGACTLNVDGLGAKPLRKNASLQDFAASELVTGQTMVVTYNSSTDDFECVGPVTDSSMEAGTVMVFAQVAAPTTWTKNVTHDNKALRLQTGVTGGSAGGSFAFTTVFAARTLLQGNLPAVNLSHSLTSATHSHTVSGNTSTDGAHNHSYERPDNNTTRDSSGSTGVWQDDTSSSNTSTNGSHFHSWSGTSSASGALTVSGTVALGGGGVPVDFGVQYVDVILATKN